MSYSTNGKTTRLAAACAIAALLAVPAGPAAADPPLAVDEEFGPPTPVAWGMGKNYVRITGASAFSTFEGGLRISLQPQLEYLVADRFGIRLVGDIPVFSDDPTSVFQIYWDNVVHLLPYRRTDLFGGLGTGLSVLHVRGQDWGTSPLLTGLLGFGLHPRSPWTLGIEGRFVWWAEPLDGGGMWMLGGALQAGVVF